MSSINAVVLHGRVTRDPELRETTNGTPVINTGIAVERYVKDGENAVSFFDFALFGNFATLCAKKLRKGDSITLEGRLEQRKWEDAEGNARSKVEVVASNLVGEFIYRKADGSDTPESAVADIPDQTDPEAADDDIPF